MGKNLTQEVQRYLRECDLHAEAKLLDDCVMESYWRTMAQGNDEAYEREVFDITVFLPVLKFRMLGEDSETMQSTIKKITSEYAFSQGRLIHKFEWQPYIQEEKSNKSMNWVQIFNRLFELINTQGDTYYGGTRYLDTIREVNFNVPNYSTYIEQRRAAGQSTSRKDYYYDLLLAQPEADRITIVNSILDLVGHHQPQRTAIIRGLLAQHQPAQGPQVQIPTDIWNAERLTQYIEQMDATIVAGNYGHTLTLAYTCLEGFYKSYIREEIPDQVTLTELTPMAVQIRNHIKAQLDANGIVYPEPVLILISTVTNAVCNARNNFSDSHSGNPAEKWLAVYVRDNVNAIVRMLLHFI